MAAKTIMIQGTTSNAGKTLLAAGLCRILKRDGFSVAPFKPQNMALNSAVTADGGEIGRAQAFQAEAAGIIAHTDMNPILLKPNTNTGAQLIVQGKVVANMDALTYHKFKPQLMPTVLESYYRLAEQYDWIIVEGAGSPAEINLRDGDIANMGFAERIKCPVLIVSDIDRGGVFAHLFGTLAVLNKTDRDLIAGFVINKFRGTVDLLSPGVKWLEKATGRPVYGILPFIKELAFDAEDSLSRLNCEFKQSTDQTLNVVIPLTPHLSNDSDFSALITHPQINLRYAHRGDRLGPSDLIILAGSKNVQADLAFLISQEWHSDIYRHLRYGGKVIGLCGGFQMLGNKLHDPNMIESTSGSVDGLRLLDMETTLEQTKQLSTVSGFLFTNQADVVEGYEIHMGKSSGHALTRPAVILDDRSDGAVSTDNQIIGTYVHGIFDRPTALRALLQWAGLKEPLAHDHQSIKASQFDLLADTIKSSLDLQSVFRLPDLN